MAWMSMLQWPAMVITIIAAWLVGSRRAARRTWGFWSFLLSNALWVAWGLHDHAFALVMLQAVLAVTNVRGMVKNNGAAGAG
jgi:hypothetical protein